MPTRAAATASERREMPSLLKSIAIHIPVSVRRAQLVAPTSLRFSGLPVVCRPNMLNLRHRNKQSLNSPGRHGQPYLSVNQWCRIRLVPALVTSPGIPLAVFGAVTPVTEGILCVTRHFLAISLAPPEFWCHFSMTCESREGRASNLRRMAWLNQKLPGKKFHGFSTSCRSRLPPADGPEGRPIAL